MAKGKELVRVCVFVCVFGVAANQRGHLRITYLHKVKISPVQAIRVTEELISLSAEL